MEENAADPFDTAEPKDILSKFTSAWVQQSLSLQDSSEKLSRINELINEADTLRLEKGNYFNLIDLIEGYFTDSD